LRPGDAMAQVTLIKPHIELIDESTISPVTPKNNMSSRHPWLTSSRSKFNLEKPF